MPLTQGQSEEAAVGVEATVRLDKKQSTYSTFDHASFS
jgi:hypothetical protein